MNRRNFLRTAGATGLVLLERPLEALSIFTKKDFEIVERTNTAELQSLEEVLQESKREKIRLDKTNPVEPIAQRRPELIYNLKVDKGKAKTIDSTMGSGITITKSGFFISVYHIFREHLENQGESNYVGLIYDSLTGIALQTRVLAYSKRFDLILGKINPTEGYPLKDTPLLPIRLLGDVYAMSYVNLEDIAGSMLTKILNYSEVSRVEDTKGKKRLNFTQRNPVRGVLGKDLIAKVSIGQVIPQHEGLEGWKSAFFAEVHEGNSGTPVFGLNNKLAGIITGSAEYTNTSSGEAHNVGIYTNTSAIRAMIQKYIASH